MNKRVLRSDILLLVTAAIWGFGFVAQRSGMEHIGPFGFNGVRFILGSLFLLPFIFINRNRLSSIKTSSANLLPASLAVGSCLFIAVSLQQIGIIFTTAGNAGFITGFYVVLTPIFGILLGRKTGIATWTGSILTLLGLYFISVAGQPSINPGDIIVIISAFFWAAHVLLIDRLMQGKPETPVDAVELSFGQFAVCGVFSLLCAFTIEPVFGALIRHIDPFLLSSGLFGWLPFPDLVSSVKSGAVSFPVQALVPVLYGGLCSVGIAYTLQVIAQRDAPPAHATIILCFEGCFAALGGVLLLGEKTGMWTFFGFIFMLTGMISTQWEVIARGQGKKDETLS
ncbi:MAG: DMT family transporter [Treponema sp.]|nr:DMT family transporter [Treponema sp.]